MKAVGAVKTDKIKALAVFNNGDGAFRDRHLYPFCANVSDGKVVAIGNPHAKQLGRPSPPCGPVGRSDREGR